jgi:hypothetical protein
MPSRSLAATVTNRSASAPKYGDYGATAFTLAALRAKAGAPGKDRTCNLQLRRLTLYPIELQARERSWECGIRSRE